MLILTIRTDNPEAEVGLFDGNNHIFYTKWMAHYQLAETIHKRIQKLIDDNSTTLSQLQGIVVYKGPGSFTGLRIGLSVANTLADSLKIPIVGTNRNYWIKTGISWITNGQNDKLVMPEYGSEPHITSPKK
jgi:tRNA threonylcarbamoyladenosine biosynthesis protein TsaB